MWSPTRSPIYRGGGNCLYSHDDCLYDKKKEQKKEREKRKKKPQTQGERKHMVYVYTNEFLKKKWDEKSGSN